jgi:CheY-like chemotaxis protein/HAMP domain-containing protein
MKNWKINTKLTVMFLLVGLTPVLVTSFYFLQQYSAQSTLQKMLELQGRNESKKFQIERWFEERMADMGILSTSEEFAAALMGLQDASTENTTSTAYQALRNEFDTKSSQYCSSYGYDDMLLMNLHGEPIYSSHYHLTDFASLNLSGQTSTSWTAQVREALGGNISLSDASAYGRHDAEEVKMYFMAPLQQGEKIVGVIALGFHAESLNQFMTASSGMGETGESFIVGEDRLLRTKLRNTKDVDILQTRVDTHDITLAFEGKSDVSLERDYRGIPTYTAYSRLEIAGLKWAVVTKMDQREASQHVESMRIMVGALLIVAALVVALVAVLFSRSVSRPLRELTLIAHRMAEGELDHEMPHNANRKDELGQLATAFGMLVETNKILVSSVASVVDGALDTYVPPRGEHDLLARSVNHMIDALRQTAAQAELIARGDFEKSVVRSERDQVGLAIERMKNALRADREENTRQHWMQSGVLEIAEVLSGAEDTKLMASNCITAISKWVGASVGAFYIKEGTGSDCAYVLLGTYAYSERKNLSNRFGPGEGLVGQAALEGKQIVLHNLPDDYIRVVSGLGESAPRSICVTPLVYEGEVLGIVEVGMVGQLGEKEQLFLERIASSVATGLEVTRSRNVLRIHQEELQASNRELQAQSAELERSEQELLAQQRSLEESNEELNAQVSLVSQSEDRLRAQQQELEAINIELTKKNEQLKKRGQEIETARSTLAIQAEGLKTTSKYKSEFMANMSHELRTPLNSLLILARSLHGNGEGNLTEEQVECAGIIHDSGKDLLDLINDILDLSKIEAGQMRLSISEVDLEVAGQGLRTQFSHMAREKGLEFTVQRWGDAPESITTDQQRLGQILKNLVGNALKFTQEGHVTVAFGNPETGVVFTNSSLKHDACLAVHVTDTGIGIASDMLHRVFGAFQQVDTGDSRTYGGTGLGLSISQEIAQLLGGEIQVASVFGQGSTFTLYLPLQAPPVQHPTTEEGAPAEVPEPSEPTVNASFISLQDMAEPEFPDDRDTITESTQTILIIEDDERFVKILQGHIRKRGFKTLVALTGEQGLLLAQRFLPDGVLLDIQLPTMDGWAVLAHLKRDMSTRHIPVHIISATESSNSGLIRGAIGHATKPISTEQLGDILDQLEKVIVEKEKHVLVVEDNDILRQETVKLLSNGDVKMTQVKTGGEAAAALRLGGYHLVILDLGLPDIQGMDLLEMLSAEGVKLPPIIVYTVRDLTVEEEKAIRNHTDSIVVKDVRSQERLLDEVALFLHHVITDLPQEKKAMISHIHDADEAMHGKVVLLVEDDMRTLFAMSKLLNEHGVITLKAENGQKAIEMLEQTPHIDMILMDMMMPVMDGYEAMRLIRAKDRFATLPIIALTAKAMAEDRSKCIAAGATDYLSKPIDSGRLLSLMRVWMGA